MIKIDLDFNNAPRQRAEFYKEPPVPKDPIAGFLHKLSEYKLEPGGIIPDGELHRFDVEKKNDKAGWYIYHHGNICAGAFGNWKIDDKALDTWCSKSKNEMTDAEAKEVKRIVADAKEQREKELIKRHEETKKRAFEVWDKAGPVKKHQYLEGKEVKAYGEIRQRGNELLIPARDADGQMWTLQRIFPDGKKRFLPGGKKSGMFFCMNGNDLDDFYICEGYSTGATIYEAKQNKTVIVAFDAYNLEATARAIRKMYPSAQITICADNDRSSAGNPGMTNGQQAAQAVNGRLVAPTFDQYDAESTDFNDLAARCGMDVVRAQLTMAPEKQPLPPLSPNMTRLKGRLTKRPPPVEFVFNFNDHGLIPRGVVGVLTATGGTGKTYFLLAMSHAAASGGNFGPIKAVKPVQTLIIIGEDPQDELERRIWDIAKGQFPDTLHAVSVYGKAGPLMRVDNGTPVRADTFHWLEKSIKGHPGLELLIIEPKSRFYGLDENNSDHATQWVQSLEYLSKEYNLTILFSHHTAKDNSEKITQNMSRGSSAIVDGCRWQGGLARMDKDFAKKNGIENRREYVEFDAPKSNYAADMPSSIFYKRGPHGILQYVNVKDERQAMMSRFLYEMLKSDPTEYTIRELYKKQEGVDITKDMKEKFPSFVRSKDMRPLIDHMIERGRLKEIDVETEGAGRARRVLQTI